jgi:hypothetical protein
MACVIIKGGAHTRGVNAYTNGEEGNGLVDAAKRRNVHGLTTHGTLRANTGGILTRTSVNDGINENLSEVSADTGLS